MGYYILGFITTIIEAICCLLFYEAFSEKRYKSRGINLFLGALTVGVFITAVFTLDNYMVVKLLVLIVAITLIMTLSKKLVLWKSFVIAMLYYGLIGAIDILFYISYMALIDNFHVPDSGINWSLATILSKLADFLAVIIIKKHVSKGDSTYNLKGSEWLRFIVFPVFTVGMILAMMSDTQVIGDAHLENVYLLFAIGLVLITVAAFYLICDIVKRERRIREDDLFREKVKNQTEMYRSVYDNYEVQRKRAHEYKNQIMCMEALLQKKEYAELEKYITEIGGKLTDADSNINTNNTLIDAIINTKYREMEEQGILLVMKFNEMADLWMDDEDVVVILSNLLNNAIEACEKCEEKTVKMKLMKESDDIIISVRNTYNGEIVMKGDEIQTSKNDKAEHGLGIKNVIEAVEKYGGSYSINHDDKEFAFSICIPKA